MTICFDLNFYVIVMKMAFFGSFRLGSDIELLFLWFDCSKINNLNFGGFRADTSIGEELAGSLFEERFFLFGWLGHRF